MNSKEPVQDSDYIRVNNCCARTEGGRKNGIRHIWSDPR